MINNASDERLTVGQLKEVLSHFDDSTEIVVPYMKPDPRSFDYDQTGILFEVVTIDTGTMDEVEYLAFGVTPIQFFPETPAPTAATPNENGLAS